MEKQIAGNPAGWSVKQVMSLIYEKSGARYHEVHAIGCFAIGDTHQGLHRKDLQTLRLHGKNSGLKKISGKIALKTAKGFAIRSQDESILATDSIFGKKMPGKERNASSNSGNWEYVIKRRSSLGHWLMMGDSYSDSMSDLISTAFWIIPRNYAKSLARF